MKDPRFLRRGREKSTTEAYLEYFGEPLDQSLGQSGWMATTHDVFGMPYSVGGRRGQRLSRSRGARHSWAISTENEGYHPDNTIIMRDNLLDYIDPSTIRR